MESQVNETLQQKEEERHFQSQLRDRMSSQLVPHACNDFEFNTTIEVFNRTWHYEEIEGLVKTYTMRVVHERPSSLIFFTQRLASTRECEAAVNSIDPQTNTIPWSALDSFGTDGILLHNLATKVYEMARAALELSTLNMKVDKTIESSSLFEVHQYDNNQESVVECDATSNDEEQQQDQGVCQVTTTTTTTTTTTSSTSPLLLPTKSFHVDDLEQLGTAFLFCDVPPEGGSGGAIHFPSAGIHINPEPGMLIFAAHRQPKYHDDNDELMMDGFVQDYHMCPYHNDVLTRTFGQLSLSPDQQSASSSSQPTTSNRPRLLLCLRATLWTMRGIK